MCCITKEDQAPLVSIGIPTYRRPQELEECLRQILNQTYSNIEVIVSDNASEGSEVVDLLESVRLTDSRVCFFRQEQNIGPVENFQFVLDHAQGKYFMWCADDDWHAPEFVARMVALHEVNPNLSLAFCNFTAIDPEGREVTRYGDFLPRLRMIAVTSRRQRQWRFFIQDEALGKANMIYGLMRRDLLIGFDWVRFVGTYGWKGADNLFLFKMLGMGSLGIVEERLYASRVGNDKHYLAPRSRFGAIRELFQWGCYFGQYARLAPWPLVMAYLLGGVVKFLRFASATMRRVLRQRFK
jgi:glycosyltransferase involved in cell wall biosynthesis